MSQFECYAVLTGDIIKSTALSQNDLEGVRAGVLNAVDEVKGWKRGLVKGKAEFFRGDTWQLLLTNPAIALRVGVFLRASLLAAGKADSRIAVGLGKVEKVSPSRVSLSTGEAFILSGHGLDRMTQYSRMTISVPKSAGAMSEWLPVVGHLCDALIGRWTERQAQIVCIAVNPREPKQEDIAEMLAPPISRQAVTKALDGADWNSVRATIRQFEATDWISLFQGKKGM